jgi:hypothetical protein
MSWRVQVRVCAQNVREHRSVAGGQHRKQPGRAVLAAAPSPDVIRWSRTNETSTRWDVDGAEAAIRGAVSAIADKCGRYPATDRRKPSAGSAKYVAVQ